MWKVYFGVGFMVIGGLSAYHATRAKSPLDWITVASLAMVAIICLIQVIKAEMKEK